MCFEWTLFRDEIIYCFTCMEQLQERTTADTKRIPLILLYEVKCEREKTDMTCTTGVKN